MLGSLQQLLILNTSIRFLMLTLLDEVSDDAPKGNMRMMPAPLEWIEMRMENDAFI